MNMKNTKYVAGCIFTIDNPKLSLKIQNYLKERFQIPTMRCCVPDYKDFTPAMPQWYQKSWRETPEYVEFEQGDAMVYICHNCAAIFEETKPEIQRIPLWKIVLMDDEFPYHDYNNEKITLQDCWRTYDNYEEQQAVRELMKKMNIDVVELEENYDKTNFCGVSLYASAPERNLKLAPNRFVRNAKGKFIPRLEAEQAELMKRHGEKIMTDKVVAYCHYCVKGLRKTDKDARHLAELLFGESVDPIV